MGMIREFREFAIKGNALDLAVALIIGVEFGKIVNSIVHDLIMPPLGLLIGGVDFKNIYILLKSGAIVPPPYSTLVDAQKAGAVTLNIGAFATTALTFVIIVFAVFLIVKLMNKFRGPALVPAPANQK